VMQPDRVFAVERPQNPPCDGHKEDRGHQTGVEDLDTT
jgi:hypothetical protein